MIQQNHLNELLDNYKKAQVSIPKATFRSVMSIILVPAMFFGWFFGITTFALSMIDTNFEKDSIQTTGILQKKEVTKSCKYNETSDGNRSNSSVSSKSCNDVYAIKYSYSVDKQVFNGYSGIDISAYSTLSLNDSVKVYYEKNNPSNSRTEFNLSKLGVFKYLPTIALSVAFISTISFVLLQVTKKPKL